MKTRSVAMALWVLSVLAMLSVRWEGTSLQAAELEADAAAAKLLKEARAARAHWVGFPGFTADIQVNRNGKTSSGQVHVGGDGKIEYRGLDKPAQAWAGRILGSLVAHRMSGAAADTPCAFVGDDQEHPLGRAVALVGDAMNSRYRIRDNQILVVDRRTKAGRFIITVLENQQNAEGKHLPVSFVINHWSNFTGQLIRSDAYHQRWQRIDGFDLPVSVRVVTANPAKVKAHRIKESDPHAHTTDSLTLRNHRKLEADAN